MLQLIYTSTAKAFPSVEDVIALCEQAARNNGRDEITGILMAQGSTFLQVLEGPREVVEDTFLRIMVDDRHHSLLLLHRRMTTAREFGDWSMAMCGTPDERQRTIERVRSRMATAPVHLQRQFEQRFGNGTSSTGSPGSGGSQRRDGARDPSSNGQDRPSSP